MTIRGHCDLHFLIHIRCDQGTRLGLFTYLVAVLVVLEACVVVHKTVQLLEALVFLLCLEEPLATLVTGYTISDMSLTKAESDCQYIGVFCWGTITDAIVMIKIPGLCTFVMIKVKLINLSSSAF